MKKFLSDILSWPSESNFILSDEVSELEQLLQSQLAPVPARPAFVRDLGTRLGAELGPTVEAKRKRAQQESDIWQRIILTTAGIVSGVLLLLLGVRAIISIIEAVTVRQRPRRTA